MENKGLTRKDFILLTFTLIGTTAVAGSACDDDDNTTGAGGTSGGGTGRAGTTGTAGSGTGSAGSGGTTGTAGSGSGGTTGAAGSGGGVTACNAPQVPDTTGHTHTLTVSASILGSTTTQTLNTSLADGHVHGVNLTPANLQALAGGGSVTVMSQISSSHTHMFMVTCS